MRLLILISMILFALPPATLIADGSHPKAVSKNGLAVEAVWARASIITIAAAFMTIRNNGQAPDQLLSVASDVAVRVEIHRTRMSNGMMEMGPVDRVVVPSGGAVVFKPGGYHLMLIGLKRPLKRRGMVKLMLRFKNAGEIPVTAVIRGPGALEYQSR